MTPDWGGSACRAAILAGTADRAWWFPEEGGWDGPGRKARAVCAACPIKGACLAYALEQMESGIWGGTCDDDRAKMRGAVVARVCSECGTAFETPRGNTGSLTCSPLCREARLARLKRKRRDEARVVYEAGHGIISRYHAGCRCPACKRASREARTRQRAKARAA